MGLPWYSPAPTLRTEAWERAHARNRCGNIVVSEEGDTRRAIGFYGDTIHNAARMEQEAKELGTDLVVSEEVGKALEISPM